MLHYCLYISKAHTQPLSADDALILLQARNRNAQNGITGYLHREGGYFVQYVEGPPEKMKALKFALSRDNRHSDMKILDAGTIPKRRFRGWDMAFSMKEMGAYQLYASSTRSVRDITKAPAEQILDFMTTHLKDSIAQVG